MYRCREQRCFAMMLTVNCFVEALHWTLVRIPKRFSRPHRDRPKFVADPNVFPIGAHEHFLSLDRSCRSSIDMEHLYLPEYKYHATIYSYLWQKKCVVLITSCWLNVFCFFPSKLKRNQHNCASASSFYECVHYMATQSKIIHTYNLWLLEVLGVFFCCIC